MDIRQKLVMAHSVDAFRVTLLDAAKELATEQSQWRERKNSIHLSEAKEQVVGGERQRHNESRLASASVGDTHARRNDLQFGPGPWFPLRGLYADIKRRRRHYLTDYLDGFRGHKTIQKLFSTIIFLYFACLLPAIAFGVLNDDNTNGLLSAFCSLARSPANSPTRLFACGLAIRRRSTHKQTKTRLLADVRKVVFAQAIGGIFFAMFGGQPMIILLTTVPLAIYIKVIYRIAEDLGYDFYAMYACVGLSCQFFLIVYACTELCSFMKLATRQDFLKIPLFIESKYRCLLFFLQISRRNFLALYCDRVYGREYTRHSSQLCE